MTDREKLVGLIVEIENEIIKAYPYTTEQIRIEKTADYLLANGVTVQNWRDAKTEPPEIFRDECRELIPFLVVCEDTTEPFRAFYDGKVWGNGWGLEQVTHWMPLPEPPKEETYNG